MPTYQSETNNAQGKMQAGVISAPTLAAASQMLRDRGEYILSLTPVQGGHRKKAFDINASLSFGPSAKDVQNFTSQLAVMIRAGISIRSAVGGISEQVINPKFKAILVQMRKDVEGGKQFSDALLRHPKAFSPLDINMLRASDPSARFSQILSVAICETLFRALDISRSLHTMGQLINAGVPMLDTISITAEIAGNTMYRRMWRGVYGAVKQGKKISTPLQKSPLLPRSVVQMISAGAQSGKLIDVLYQDSQL